MRVAVTGLGILTGIGYGVDETLDAIRAGRSGLGEVTLFPTRHRVPISEVKRTDDELKALLGLPRGGTVPRTALLGMAAARQALDDAGEAKGLRTALVSGTSTGGMDRTERFFVDFLQDPQKGRLRDVASHDCADSTKRIAALCGITGFSTTISTACSSAANAIMMGAELILRGMADRVVAGGTDALCKFTLNGFRSLMILDGAPCRPFDATRAGLNLGEGAGYVVLQRDDTLTEKPYAYLTGFANANDAFHQTASSAEGTGARLAMEGALAMSGLKPENIGYINAHGTGTPNNDASELAAIRTVFGNSIPPFSSVKPFTGHTLAAAGGIEAVLSILSAARGLVYPNLNFSTPMPEDEAIPVLAFAEQMPVKNVLSNSFGFGGNNSTLIFSAD